VSIAAFSALVSLAIAQQAPNAAEADDDVPPRHFHGCRFALLTARRKKRLADICVYEMKRDLIVP